MFERTGVAVRAGARPATTTIEAVRAPSAARAGCSTRALGDHNLGGTMKLGASICVAMILAVLVGCSSSKDLSSAESLVSQFHTALSNQQLSEISAQCDDNLKKADIAPRLEALLGVIGRKLGRVTNTNRTGWRVNYGTGGEQITLQYQTKFEKGSGVEDFVYVVRGGKTLLNGYHITSDELILN